MKALTLQQPWAALVAQGHKTIETRSWKTNYRGPLAIHAGKVKADVFKTGWAPWIPLMPEYPKRYEIAPPLEFGAVVATCRLVDVLPIRDSMNPDSSGDYIIVGHEVGVGFIGDRDFGMLAQVPLGDFTPGRFAWLLADVKRCFIPATGHQGLWNLEMQSA